MTRMQKWAIDLADYTSKLQELALLIGKSFDVLQIIFHEWLSTQPINWREGIRICRQRALQCISLPFATQMDIEIHDRLAEEYENERR